MKCKLKGCQRCHSVIKVLILIIFIGSFVFLILQLCTMHYSESPAFVVQNHKGKKVNSHSKSLVHNNVNVAELWLIKDIQERMPNLPIVYWNENKRKGLRFNSSCAQFPDMFNIEFSNVYWQTLRTTNGTFQLFGAYLDVRKNNILGPTIRILAMLDRIEPTVKSHCQIWLENKRQPVIVKTLEYKYMWHMEWGNYEQGIYQPYLITCQIPNRHWNGTAPAAVSLVEKSCDKASNGLKVIYNKPQAEKKDFAVCVKGLDFPHLDHSVRLAEWIELLNLLGADKIFLYELGVHPNVSKILRHYEKQGKVHVTPLTLAGGQPNGPFLQHFFLTKKIIYKGQNELIPYNDCFYKHMYEYKFIVLLDTDEVIIPINGNTWKELMDVVLLEAKMEKNVQRASFNVRNVYFPDDLLHDRGRFNDTPHYMHMLQHVYRSMNFTKPEAYIMSFFNTEKILILHNNFPMGCLGNCFSYSIDTSNAQLQNYRSDCLDELKESCANLRNNSVLDTTIWKFKKPLIERVSSSLKALGYFTRDET